MVTDYFTNFPEVGQLQSTSSKAVISYLKTVFTRHGILCELFTDNGPQFSSCEFASFAKERGFHHTTLFPTYPKSNGLAESSVKTVKGLMKKAVEGDDFQKSLLIYRSKPLQNGLSPAQINADGSPCSFQPTNQRGLADTQQCKQGVEGNEETKRETEKATRQDSQTTTHSEAW